MIPKKNNPCISFATATGGFQREWCWLWQSMFFATMQFILRFMIVELKPDQYILILAWRLMPPHTPWWAACRHSKVNFWCLEGMTVRASIKAMLSCTKRQLRTSQNSRRCGSVADREEGNQLVLTAKCNVGRSGLLLGYGGGRQFNFCLVKCESES